MLRKLMYHTKRLLSLSLLFSMLLPMVVLPASANSAEMEWGGIDATGAILTGENCPLTVEHELLTFKIEHFPESDYREADDFLTYTGSVTAEYTFYNPADYTVNATLVFPFGAVPDYTPIRDRNTKTILSSADIEKYKITVDGQTIDRTLRHTLTSRGEQFEPDKDMAKLHDGFMPDRFYAPDLPVTAYYYTPSGVDTETYPAARAAITVSTDPTRTRLYMMNQSGGEVLENGFRMSGRINSDEPFILYVIGQPPAQMPEWKFYENGTCTKEIEGHMIETAVESLSLRDVLLQKYDPASGILDYDWYNAMVTALNDAGYTYGVIRSTSDDLDISHRLMRWYQYELTLAPGQRLVNRVTAPIYPDINGRYEPPIYTYTYLLSPARTWAAFGPLDIVIDTPFYRIEEDAALPFERVDSGYVCHLDGLPEGELTFTLCSKPKTKIPARIGFPENLLYMGGTVLLLATIITVFARFSGKRK